jgi:phenylpyruvate tautomerase PptA (4-oxalocrotonate tautomerase family)
LKKEHSECRHAIGKNRVSRRKAGAVPSSSRQRGASRARRGGKRDPNYLDIERTDDIVMIQITLNQRTQQVKVALYKAIADRLAKNPGMRTEDVLISLVPVSPEDWSFGNGKAQYVKTET